MKFHSSTVTIISSNRSRSSIIIIAIYDNNNKYNNNNDYTASATITTVIITVDKWNFIIKKVTKEEIWKSNMMDKNSLKEHLLFVLHFASRFNISNIEMTLVTLKRQNFTERSLTTFSEWSLTTIARSEIHLFRFFISN